MKNILLAGLFLATVSFVGINTNEEQVKEMDRHLNHLIVTHNAAQAASIYADDFILTTSSGNFKSKRDMLNEIASTEVVLELNETNEVKVRLLGNTAVLTGKLHQKGIYKGKAFDARLLVTDTWVRVGKEWKLLAGHATVVK